ncbi:MAG TPA: helix-turn-helix transcriptional regulator [Solirubrobacterales bacterium]|nr:helix-turn-helix transcriptional regulator [Solirubrobacterales bacterium]
MSDDLAKRFAENLTHYRSKSGLSQEALAAKAEIHRTQVSELQRGQQLPRLDTLVKLAGALGIPPCDLLDGLAFEPAARRGRFKITPTKKN